MGKGGFVEFKPARRVFAGRGRSLLTFGEWRIALAGICFGGLIGAGWFVEFPRPLSMLALVEASAPAPTPPPVAVPAISPVAVAEIGETPAAGEVLPRIVTAAEDGRRDRAASSVTLQGMVSRVVDGDTFYLEGVETRIRLWGVDAPERDEAGFDEATVMLAALVADKPLACEQVDVDRYQRIVARCFFEDGVDLSKAMIDSGAAEEYLRYTAGYYSGVN